ncbi:MAG: FtsQ-type POTRA domain-containing protein [Acidimicrobiaceae bacterium]|nr:FtsQ-type POTRA domain-containing protein [Acidimicrobiaceae bacterium]
MSRTPLVSSDGGGSRRRRARRVPRELSPRDSRVTNDSAPSREPRSARRAPSREPRREGVENVVDIARPRRRRRWRRIGGVLAAGLLAGLLAEGVSVVLHSSYFRVSQIEVVGATHESSAQIIAASGLGTHPAMMDVSPANVAARLARFNWIDHVSVVTHWPHRVVITVTETHAVAVTFVGTQHLYYVGDQGQDLGPAPSTSVLPTLVGPLGLYGQKSWIFRGAPAASVAAQLPNAFRAQVREVHQSTSGSISLVMTTPLTFVLGPATELNAKFVAIASAIAHASFAPGDVVDVSTPSEIAVSGPSSSS